MQKYKPILDIPEGECGGYSIRHKHFKADEVFHTASARTAFMGGDRDTPFTFGHPGHFHELHSNKDGIWMVDVPIEQAQANAILARCHYQGVVLVGGLGLGYALTRIARKPKVRQVVVVEIAQAVIDLVFPHLEARVRNKTTAVCGDLLKYVKTTPQICDHAFYDTWQSDGEGTFFETVVPLLRTSGKAGIRNRPDCWNEHIMRGQLVHSLQSRVIGFTAPKVLTTGKDKVFNTLDDLCERQGTIWVDWSVPFFRWYRAESPSEETLEGAIRFYAYSYGLPTFRKAWKTFTRGIKCQSC